MDGILAEYNNLWNKLNLITEYHHNLFLFSLTSSGAILTFGLQQNNPYIVCVNLIILFLLRSRVTYYRNEYFQIRVYIEMQIEPKIEIESSGLRVFGKSKLSVVQYFVYSVLAIGTCITCYWINSNKIIILLSILCAICIIICDIYYYFFNTKLYKQYQNELKTFRKNIK